MTGQSVRMRMGEDRTGVQGRAGAEWEGVLDAFAESQAGDAGAAQLTVYHHSRPVVDVWTATRHPGPRPFGRESVGVLMSVTKGLLAVCVHLLSQRGALDVDAPVARHWPEYAVNGKQGTTVADLLTHSAGLPAFTGDPADVAGIDLLDWDGCVARLAAADPVWQPGAACSYHALTYGHLVGEVVRRVTGVGVGAFFAAEVAAPLDLDLWIGLPQEEEHRFVPQHCPAPPPTRDRIAMMPQAVGLDHDDRLARSLLASFAELSAVTTAFDSRAGRAAEIPAAGGIGNARSLARLYASLIGHVDGIRLLSPLTVDRARTPRTDHLPAPLRRPANADTARFGLGFELPRSGLPMLGDGSFGHAGAGGRLGMAHPESGLAVGYTCTEMAWDPAAGPDPRWLPWTRAIHEAAGLPAGR
ncbi:serine hydrolase domain-containing protein [Streptomyces sp. NPDC056333]|uniref:serine hydrolase domain-containing protein n=1 Tax=Streptomyces sp. NPDC056333 TaxID=3345786 RepID=UPI0035E1C44B